MNICLLQTNLAKLNLSIKYFSSAVRTRLSNTGRAEMFMLLLFVLECIKHSVLATCLAGCGSSCGRGIISV